MTTMHITKQARSTIKHALPRRNELRINPRGIIATTSTAIAVHNTDDTHDGPWGTISPRYTHTVLDAATLHLDNDGTLTTRDEHGTTSEIPTRIDPGNLTPPDPLADPDENIPHITIDADLGTNRTAFKLLYATAERDDTKGHAGLHLGTNDPLTGGLIATTTDQFQLTRATPTTSHCDPCTATTPLRMLRELGTHTHWSLTVDTSTSTATFPTLGITVATLNNTGEFPPTWRLIPDGRKPTSTLSVHPKSLGDAAAELDPYRANRDTLFAAPFVLTEDGTAYTTDSPVVTLPGAHTFAAGVGPVGFNPTYLRRQARALGARWGHITLSWTNNVASPASLDYGNGLTGLLMPLRWSTDDVRPRTAEDQVSVSA